jgi:gamma-aminobutyric acid type B receptor
MLFALATVVWVFIHRKHKVLTAAQPYFLYLLCFGAIVEASAILPISFDESYGWSTEQLSSACMATPWLLSLGFIVTYGALFAKLWRVNRVLQFTRVKIELRHVAWPLLILVLMAFLILSLWTGLDPLRWQRIILNEATGETIGQCDSDQMAVFVLPLAVVMAAPAILTCWMAWKTKDIDDAYSESYWIFMLVLVQLEVILVSAPIISILRDESTNAKYVGFCFMLWVLPTSTLTLIMLPKFIAYFNATHEHAGGSSTARSNIGNKSGGVRVSGLVNNSNTPAPSAFGGTTEPSRTISNKEELDAPMSDSSSASKSKRIDHSGSCVLSP